MLIDGTISKEVYDDKMIEFNRKLHILDGKKLLEESISDRVLVGGYNEDGTADPYKLTFVLKGNQLGAVQNAKEQFKVKNY